MAASTVTKVNTPLSNAVSFLTDPLEHTSLIDDGTLARLRAILATNFAQHFAYRGGTNVFQLEGSVMPPKPILNAGFAVRMRWSDWFLVLSPSGTPIMLTVVEDRKTPAALTPSQPYVEDEKHKPRPARGLRHVPSSVGIISPIPSAGMGTASPMLSFRGPSIVPILVTRHSTFTAQTSFCSSSHSASPSLDQNSMEVDAWADHKAPPIRCPPRRQRGGVNQKKRGIHIDKTKLDVTLYWYDGGFTSVITGGVMLGRRVRPVTTGLPQTKPQ